MSSREILTFQLGHYANYLGTHWWNIQETNFDYTAPSAVLHDVLYREGLSLKGDVTYTPRLLAVDLKGSLGTLTTDGGDLYQDEQPEQSEFDVVEQQRIEPVQFQRDLREGADVFKKQYDFENDVRVWSDFLYSKFHPRSLNLLNTYEHRVKDRELDYYPQGLEAWQENSFSEDFVDLIRRYAEECDNLQGFHMIFDARNGFSGLQAKCSEYLQDEYTNKTILGLPVNTNCQDPTAKLNLLFSYDSLHEHSSLFIPISNETNLPGINQNFDLQYHTSAIAATYLDTLTLSYRLKNSSSTLSNLCHSFNAGGRKAAAASLNLPFQMEQHLLIDILDRLEGPLLTNLTPNCQIDPDNCLQLLVSRGLDETKLKNASHIQMPAFKCDSVKEMLDYYLECTCFGSKSQVVTVQEQMNVKTPFPQFFKSGTVDKVTVLAGIHSGRFLKDTFESLSDEVEKLDYKRFHQFSNAIHKDEFKESLEHLLDLRDCYSDNQML